MLTPIGGPRTSAPNSTNGIEPRSVDAGQLATAVYITGSTSLEPGRRYIMLVVSEPGSRSGIAVAFMSVAGTTSEGLATAIVDAARAAAQA